MANLGANGFDYNDVPDDDFLPAGEYGMRIVESEMVPTKKGDGQYLKLTLEVFEGPRKGQRHWENLNLINPNQMAVNIAQKQLKKICEATGAPVPLMDSVDLHNKPFFATFTVKEDSYGKKSDLKKCRAYVAGQPAQGEAAKPDKPAAGGGDMPWDN